MYQRFALILYFILYHPKPSNIKLIREKIRETFPPMLRRAYLLIVGNQPF